MRLDAQGRAPAVGLVPGSRFLGAAAEHNAAGEDGRLAAIVRGDVVLGGVNENACLPGALATRLSRVRVLVARLGGGGRIGRPRGRGVRGLDGREGETRARVRRAGAGARVGGDGGERGDRARLGELGENGRDPRRGADLVGNHGEDLLVGLGVILQQLLCDSFGLRCCFSAA